MPGGRGYGGGGGGKKDVTHIDFKKRMGFMQYSSIASQYQRVPDMTPRR